MKQTNPIILIVRGIFAATLVSALVIGTWTSIAGNQFATAYFVTALTALVSLVITHVPDFFIRKDIMLIPAAVQAAFSVFVFGAMFLGEILDFYELFSWWDTMLHFSSGVLFSVIGALFFISTNRKKSIRSQLNPTTIVMFAVCFSVACGAVWEMFEFAGDSLLGMNMQKWQSSISQMEWSALQNATNYSNPGLVNTMKDIIADVFGSVVSIALVLPIAKHKCCYQKTTIPSQALLEELNAAYALVLAKQRNGKALSPALTTAAVADEFIALQQSRRISANEERGYVNLTKDGKYKVA